jgi:hypothetical protein
VDLLGEGGERGFPLEGEPASGQLEENDVKGVDIRATVDGVGHPVFRAHVLGRAHPDAGAGETLAFEHPGNAEIRQERPVTRAEQDIPGLDSAVNAPC